MVVRSGPGATTWRVGCIDDAGRNWPGHLDRYDGLIGDRVIGVILTDLWKDGTEGLKAVHEALAVLKLPRCTVEERVSAVGRIAWR